MCIMGYKHGIDNGDPDISNDNGGTPIHDEIRKKKNGFDSTELLRDYLILGRIRMIHAGKMLENHRICRL